MRRVRQASVQNGRVGCGQDDYAQIVLYVLALQTSTFPREFYAGQQAALLQSALYGIV